MSSSQEGLIPHQGKGTSRLHPLPCRAQLDVTGHAPGDTPERKMERLQKRHREERAALAKRHREESALLRGFERNAKRQRELKIGVGTHCDARGRGETPPLPLAFVSIVWCCLSLRRRSRSSSGDPASTYPSLPFFEVQNL